MREAQGEIYPMPAPTQGLNNKLPLPAIPEGFALSLINLYPTLTGVKKRNGTERMTTTACTSAMETVMSYNAEAGTSVIVVAGDNDLATVNLTTFAKTSVKGACTITSNKWQWTQFYDRLFIANGVDRVLLYPSAGNFAAAGFTIGGSADDDLYSPHSYSERMWFCKGTSLFYGDTRAVTGALDEIDLATILTKGGKLLFAGSSTNDLGSGAMSLLVAVTTEGEVLVFSGDPGDSTWMLEARYYMPKCLSRTSFINMGSDLQLITEQGVISLSDVINPSVETQKTGRYVRATDNIDGVFSTYAKFYDTLYGWCGINYTRGDLLIINIPISTTKSVQYVMNTLTGGAWGGPFIELDAACWCISQGYAYFGGFDGQLYRFDLVRNDKIYNGSAGSPIQIQGETAFTYAGDPTMLKALKLIAPLIYATADVSLSVAINTNFGRGAIPATSLVVASGTARWDTAPWDTASWADGGHVDFQWRSVEGSGLNFSICFGGLLDNVDFELLMFLIQLEKGGVGL